MNHTKPNTEILPSLLSLAPGEDAIRLRAYHLAQQRRERSRSNDPHADWQAAEAQLREEHELLATWLSSRLSDESAVSEPKK